MTIPNGPKYPLDFDTNDNLFVVHDSLRVQLAEDYNPGDTSITIIGNDDVVAKFPPSGIITLTEQCSEPEIRAISFYYGSRTDSTFDQLQLMPNFKDVGKPKLQTIVTQSVYADHHNVLKDACIAIEQFIGKKGTMDTDPLGDTLVGRLNYLRKGILTPKAWFTVDKTTGIVPVTISFIDQSLRMPTSWKWSFGDGSSSDDLSNTLSNLSSISSISNISSDDDSLTPIADGPVSCGNLAEPDAADRVITHTYFSPGKYSVSLTVGNEFGRDSVVFSDIIMARAPAPDEATIAITPTKVRINQLVNVEVTDAGEQRDINDNIVDPIEEYTWNLSDDLPHDSLAEAIAIYSVGGIYDVKLRVDTIFGAYRITTISEAINVVESTNLYLMAFDSPVNKLSIAKTLKTYEFGLISESFKSDVMPELTVERDYSFLNGYGEKDYQTSLFLRNNGFSRIGEITSGDRGAGLLFWAKDERTIQFKKFEPFDENWTSPDIGSNDTVNRNWNWLSVSDGDELHILFGLNEITSKPSDIAKSRTRIDLGNFSVSSDTYALADFINGADELYSLADEVPATYRSCSQGNFGFFARNDAGPGGFFRIRNFYRTEGTVSDIASDIRKLNDIAGTARTEVALVPLTSGIYVFNNSGEVSAYNPTTNVWTTGGPGLGSAFRAFQDTSVDGFAELNQPLLSASDGDRRAYLSFGYSSSAFIKFNESDLTFSTLAARPTPHEQFVMTIF